MSALILFVVLQQFFSLVDGGPWRALYVDEIRPIRGEQSGYWNHDSTTWASRKAFDRDLWTQTRVVGSGAQMNGPKWFRLVLDKVYCVSKVIWLEQSGSTLRTYYCSSNACSCSGDGCNLYNAKVSGHYKTVSQYLPKVSGCSYGDVVTISPNYNRDIFIYEIAVIGKPVGPCAVEEGKLQGVQKEYAISKANLVKVQNDLKEEKGKVEKIQNDLDDEKEKLAVANKRITELKADLAAEKKKLDDANEKNTELKADVDGEKKKLSDANNEITGLKADLEEAKKKACSGICTLPEYTLKVMCDDKTTIYVDGIAKTKVFGTWKSNQLATIKIPSTTKDVRIKCYNLKVTTANGIKAQIFDSDGNLLSNTGKDWECSKAASSGYEAATITDHHPEWKNILNSGDVIWTSSPKDATAYCKKILS